MNNISAKIAEAIYRQGRNAHQIADVIKVKQTNELKSYCNISSERIQEIINGAIPTVIECMVIGQVLGLGLGYFYCNAK